MKKDPFLIADIALFVRDKLNDALKRKANKEGGSPTRPGYSVCPKVKVVELEPQVKRLYNNQPNARTFWEDNKEELSNWALAMYHAPLDLSLLHNKDGIRLYIKLDQPIKPQQYGKLFFNGHYLANVFTYEDIPENEPVNGLAIFNRDQLAFKLDFPAKTCVSTNYKHLLCWVYKTIVDNNMLPKLQAIYKS